jgi:hypothetical protein
MFSRLKRWITRPETGTEFLAGQNWAKKKGARLKYSHPHDGFVIEMPQISEACRVEWGPAQRHYMGAKELRIRAATPLDPSVHAAIMDRDLMGALEKEVFNLYLDSAQTRLDTAVPEEMRWLAMSTKLTALQTGPSHGKFGAVCNVPPWCQQWLYGELGAALLKWAATFEQGLPPSTLVAHRGRMVLRVACMQPGQNELDAAIALFEIALNAALKASHI